MKITGFCVLALLEYFPKTSAVGEVDIQQDQVGVRSGVQPVYGVFHASRQPMISMEGSRRPLISELQAFLRQLFISTISIFRSL